MTDPLPLYARIQATGANAPDLWWIGPSPWPSAPVAHDNGHPFTSPQRVQCCPDDGPIVEIERVLLHLPRNPGDPAFTVEIDITKEDDEKTRVIYDHLVERHNFDHG